MASNRASIASKSRKLTSHTLTRRETGKLLSEQIKRGSTAVTYRRPFDEKLETWSLTDVSPEECQAQPFMNAEQTSAAFAMTISKTDREQGKNTTIPPELIPAKGCNQVVIGINKDLAQYFEYNKENKQNPNPNPEYGNFILLSINDWSARKNIDYISCALRDMLKSEECDSELPILVLIPKEENMLIKKNEKGEYTPRVTALEYFQFQKALFVLDFNRLLKNRIIYPGDDFTYNILEYYPANSTAGGKRKYRKKSSTLKKRTSKKRTSKKHTTSKKRKLHK